MIKIKKENFIHVLESEIYDQIINDILSSNEYQMNSSSMLLLINNSFYNFNFLTTKKFTSIFPELIRYKGKKRNYPLPFKYKISIPSQINNDVLNYCTDYFIRDLIQHELKDLCNNKNYRINTYIETVHLSIKASEASNKKSRELFLDELDNFMLGNINNFIYFIPAYKKLTSSERKIVTSNAKNYQLYLEFLFRRLNNLNYIFGKIFRYDSIIKPYRYQIVKKLNILVCPYCNSRRIHTFPNTTTADVDHLLLKSRFPLFALSFGNFIPSCKECNQSFKNQSTKKILNPRLEGFEKNAEFHILTVEDLFKKESKNFTIDFIINSSHVSSDLINESIDVFKLKEIYNHKTILDEVKKTFNNTRELRKSKINLYLEILDSSTTFEDLYEEKVGFSLNETDFLNKPHGKLHSDIFTENLYEKN